MIGDVEETGFMAFINKSSENNNLAELVTNSYFQINLQEEIV